MPLDDAIRQTPNLLPVCGQAQQIAAERAVEQALGHPADGDRERQQDLSTYLEQVRASVWRFAVDWPRLIGVDRDLETIRAALRSNETDELKLLLGNQLDGLDAATDAAALTEWLDASTSVAARVVRAAGQVEGGKSEHFGGMRPACQSVQWVFNALSVPEPVIRDGQFRPARSAEVGVRAMARHALVAQSDANGDSLKTRLLAQVLDAAFLTGASVKAATRPIDQCSSSIPDIQGDPNLRMGIGLAITARGPLVHRVVLDQRAADRAAAWEVIAPTDWHFASSGPVASGLNEGRSDDRWAELYCAGFDPCAEWAVSDLEPGC